MIVNGKRQVWSVVVITPSSEWQQAWGLATEGDALEASYSQFLPYGWRREVRSRWVDA